MYPVQHVVQRAHRRCPTPERIHDADRTLDTTSMDAQSRCMRPSPALPLLGDDSLYAFDPSSRMATSLGARERCVTGRNTFALVPGAFAARAHANGVDSDTFSDPPATNMRAPQRKPAVPPSPCVFRLS